MLDLELCNLAVDRRKKLTTFLPGQKRRSEAVSRDLAELREGEAKMVRGRLVLVGERRVAHQPIVGVEHDVQATVVIAPERMGLVAGGGPRLDVAREAYLERD